MWPTLCLGNVSACRDETQKKICMTSRSRSLWQVGKQVESSWKGEQKIRRELATHTLQGPAVPLTSNPSSDRITTQTFDPPPSAQKMSGGVEPGGVGRRDISSTLLLFEKILQVESNTE